MTSVLSANGDLCVNGIYWSGSTLYQNNHLGIILEQLFFFYLSIFKLGKQSLLEMQADYWLRCDLLSGIINAIDFPVAMVFNNEHDVS